MLVTKMAGEWVAKCNFCTQTQRSFLFDIFLGPSYNQSPPSVKYMTVSDWIENKIYMTGFLGRPTVESIGSILIFMQ